MSKSRNKHAVDVVRFFAMFLVLCCHWPYDGVVGQILVTFSKTAVPFFIIVAGYFCYADDNKVFAKRIRKQLVKLFILMIVSNIGYGYLAYKASGFHEFSRFYKDVFVIRSTTLEYFIKYNESPFGQHLWFLGSMVYGLAILWILVKLNIHHKVFFMAPVLSIIYIILGRDQSIDFICVRNAILVTIPYLMYGCLIKKYEEEIFSKLNYIVLFGLLVLFSGVSLWELFHYKTLGIVYIGTEILSIIIVLCCVKGNGIKIPVIEHIGRQDMLFVYIVHWAIIGSIWGYYGDIDWPDIADKMGALFAFIVTILLAEIWNVGKFLVKKGYEKIKGRRER